MEDLEEVLPKQQVAGGKPIESKAFSNFLILKLSN